MCSSDLSLRRLSSGSPENQPWEIRLLIVTIRDRPDSTLSMKRLHPEGATTWRFDNLKAYYKNQIIQDLPTGVLRADATLASGPDSTVRNPLSQLLEPRKNNSIE